MSIQIRPLFATILFIYNQNQRNKALKS